MTCKNCIYKEACNQHLDEINNPKFTCATFKDRSKFIELPCKLGDRLYAINGKGEIKSWEIICIRAIKSSIQWNPEHIEYTVGCRESKGIMWIHLDKTKNVYFSLEESEQALKEREQE